jgi:hypothetical protein
MTKKDMRAAALVDLVDELGDLERELQPWRAKFSRIEALRAALRAAFARSDVKETFRAEGERWAVQIGVPGSVSVIDREALLKMIGPKKFASIANISLKSLEAACGADVVGAVVSMQPTGPRSLAILPREPETVAEVA